MENNTEYNNEMELVILFSKSEEVGERKILCMFAAETQTPGNLSDEVDAISLTEHQMLELIAIYTKQKTTNMMKVRKQAVALGTAYHKGLYHSMDSNVIYL